MAAELTNNAADMGQLVPMLKAVKANTGKDPEQALADAGYRNEKNFQDLADSPTVLVVAMGREGKRCLEIDAKKNPHTTAIPRFQVAMAAKIAAPTTSGNRPPCRILSEHETTSAASMTRKTAVAAIERASEYFQTWCTTENISSVVMNIVTATEMP